MLTIRADYYSEQGDRETNEDQAAVLAEGQIFLVADGMGGQKGGEVASRIAAETVSDAGRACLEYQEADAVFRELERIFNDANQRLMAAGRRDAALWGLATTLTLGVISGGQLFFGHLGDSRLYTWRRGFCEQLTEDHTRVREFVNQGLLSEEEAARSTQRNVLTKYLGTASTVAPQLGRYQLESGDRLLLCSDGLYNSLGSESMVGILGRDMGPKELVEQLVGEAVKRRGKNLDNVTALMVMIEG